MSNKQLRRMYEASHEADAKKRKPTLTAPQQSSLPNVSFNDFGGFEAVVLRMRRLVVQPLTNASVYKSLGAGIACGVLLKGPSGCGKTMLASATAHECGVPFFHLPATTVVSGISGSSESTLRSYFEAAKSAAPSLLFIDEIDSICPKRDGGGKQMDVRLVSQMAMCMDSLQDCDVIVLATTTREDSIDPILRSSGRFDEEVALGMPNEAARFCIIQKMLNPISVSPCIDIGELTRVTSGFVASDIKRLIHLALHERAEAILGGSEDDKVQQLDFQVAIKNVQPASRREGFSTSPNVSWLDIGGLESRKREIFKRVCAPIKNPTLFKRIGLSTPTGLLLHGPPGCGKTLLAKAVANESKAAFISVKGPELLSKYLGDSEKAVREVFFRARVSAPSVVFFDEFDSLAPARGSSMMSGDRVVNQLLTELDGVESLEGVFVIAATNRPDLIDAAMLRPGRLEKMLYVGLPSIEDRVAIFKTLTVGFSLSETDIDKAAKETEGFSGADLAKVVRETKFGLVEEQLLFDEGGAHVNLFDISISHLMEAITKTSPSVS